MIKFARYDSLPISFIYNELSQISRGVLCEIVTGCLLIYRKMYPASGAGMLSYLHKTKGLEVDYSSSFDTVMNVIVFQAQTVAAD